MSSAFGQVAAVGEFAALFTVPSIYMRPERVSEWPNKSPEPTAVGAVSPLSRFTSLVGGGSAFYVRHRSIYTL